MLWEHNRGDSLENTRVRGKGWNNQVYRHKWVDDKIQFRVSSGRICGVKHKEVVGGDNKHNKFEEIYFDRKIVNVGKRISPLHLRSMECCHLSLQYVLSQQTHEKIIQRPQIVHQ